MPLDGLRNEEEEPRKELLRDCIIRAWCESRTEPLAHSPLVEDIVEYAVWWMHQEKHLEHAITDDGYSALEVWYLIDDRLYGREYPLGHLDFRVSLERVRELTEPAIQQAREWYQALHQFFLEGKDLARPRNFLFSA